MTQKSHFQSELIHKGAFSLKLFIFYSKSWKKVNFWKKNRFFLLKNKLFSVIIRVLMTSHPVKFKKKWQIFTKIFNFDSKSEILASMRLNMYIMINKSLQHIMYQVNNCSKLITISATIKQLKLLLLSVATTKYLIDYLLIILNLSFLISWSYISSH